MKAELDLFEKKQSFIQLWDSTQDNPDERRKLVKAEWKFFEENFIKPQYFQVLEDGGAILEKCGGFLSETKKEEMFFNDKNIFKTFWHLSFEALMQEVMICAKLALQDEFTFERNSKDF